MWSRKPGYLIGVALLAIILSAPAINLGIQTGLEVYTTQRLPLPPIPGVVQTNPQNNIEHCLFWKDQFVFPGILHNAQQITVGQYDNFVGTFDPETGENRKRSLKSPKRDLNGLFPVGDRVWLFNRSVMHEIVDDILQTSSIPIPGGWFPNRNVFLWKGDLAYWERKATGFQVTIFRDGGWYSIGNVAIPEFSRERILGDTVIPPRRWSMTGGSSIQIIDSENGKHLFLYCEGRLLHHKGLDLDLGPAPNSIFVIGQNKDLVETIAHPDEPVSALKAANSDADLAGWSLVRNELIPASFESGHVHGLLIDGQPAALIIDDDEKTGFHKGRLYQLVAERWSEIASMQFPFASSRFRTATTRDGKRSYVLATTSLAATQAFALESTGFRKTGLFHTAINPWMEPLHDYAQLLIQGLVLGILLGVGTGHLMKSYTNAEYEFGNQKVRLASLRWRGVARLIDVGFIGTTTLILGALMTRGFDWMSLAEALNLHVDHPTTIAVRRIIAILAAWLIAIILTMLFMQAVWGITPGKWICRLQTIRTTLRPCGVAASLAREVVFFVDCCNFLCWTPGIVAIALSDRQQRLGDFVADTIVIEKQSLPNVNSSKRY